MLKRLGWWDRLRGGEVVTFQYGAGLVWEWVISRAKAARINRRSLKPRVCAVGDLIVIQGGLAHKPARRKAPALFRHSPPPRKPAA
jgi:hypothetical protein